MPGTTSESYCLNNYGGGMEMLNKRTLKEIQRLSPKGYKGIHVILVGNISKKVSLELNKYGYKTHHIAGHNHYETACMIPCARK